MRILIALLPAANTAYLANDASYAVTLAQQCSMIEAENEMKWAAIQPTQGVFNFTPGDAWSASRKPTACGCAVTICAGKRQSRLTD